MGKSITRHMLYQNILTNIRPAIAHTSLVTGIVIIILSVTALCRAQAGVDYSGSGGVDRINGRIYFPSGRRSDAQLKVRLDSSNAGTRVVFADDNGSFSFRNLEPGSYTVTIEGTKEYEAISETVYIDDLRSRASGGPGPPPRTYNLPIYLQLNREFSQPYGPGVLDSRLSGVPAPARDLYQKAIGFAKSGDPNKAIECLKQAISLYPDFMLAFTELGVQYLTLAQLDKAAESLTAAIKLAPEDFSPRLYYGITLLNQRKFSQAENEFRIALKKNSSASNAHLYLGMALGAQRKLEEAEKELLIVTSSKSPETARAHRYLGGIYLETRNYKRAADELEIYLKLMPDAADAERTRETIKECRHKS